MEQGSTNRYEPIDIEIVDETYSCSVLIADIVGSTKLKESQPEAAWVKGTTLLYRWALAALGPQLEHELVCIKFIGDAAMIVVPEACSAELLNAGIRLLELVNDARRGRSGGKGEIDYNITVGVASGTVVRLRMPDKGHDVIGHVPDRASRLAGLVSSNGLLADADTIAAGNMKAITSRIGHALERSAREYLGEQQLATLQGFAQSVPYHEILWGQQLYGIRAEKLSSATAQLSQVTRAGDGRDPEPRPQAAEGRAERVMGEVKAWLGDRGCGFIAAPTGDFFLSPSRIIGHEPGATLSPGRRVAFVPGPQTEEGRSAPAFAVLVDESEVRGHVTRLPQQGRPYGWLRVSDACGVTQGVFLPLDEVSDELVIGDGVTFRVDVNVRGARAVNVKKAL
jgi:class 3 adenylate cyclase/cold shock CspA family protein